jgi:hypothetical protein
MPRPPRCQTVPLPDHQVTFEIDGHERLRWHFGAQYPRPFFYPLMGPSGSPLTRMGHPGDAGHDHHRSIWFGHHSIAGQDFWSDQKETKIRQKHWLVYQDGEREAGMAVAIGWYDRTGREVLDQQLIAIVSDHYGGQKAPGETFVELQSTLRAITAPVEIGQTNFGFLAVRVAKSISAHFGGGQIRDSEGRTGEPAIFGKAAAWMDYSGPVPGDLTEGITYFDHPANPGYPSKWHVREDGWMGASVCRDGPRKILDNPLVLRYLLHAHGGPLDARRATAVAAQFGHSPPLEVRQSSKKHVGREIVRAK